MCHPQAGLPTLSRGDLQEGWRGERSSGFHDWQAWENYLLALLGDSLDHQIAALSGLVSGHTMKHVIAALAIYGVLIRLRRRRIMGHRK